MVNALQSRVAVGRRLIASYGFNVANKDTAPVNHVNYYDLMFSD